MPCDRREFVALAGAGLATLTLPAGMRTCGNTVTGDALGVQLYTLRTVLAKDFEGTLKQVAAIGYREVEFAGYYDRSPAEIRRLLDSLGLTAPAAHVPLEALRDRMEATLDAADVMGHKYLVIAWLEQRDRTPERLRAIADEFNHFGEQASARGVTFAYHNHDFEFTPVEGVLPYDLLLERTSPDVVKFEMDLFWITKGGASPLEYFVKYPGRFPLVHVKDLTTDGKMVDVGSGAIDWRAIFAKRAQAGIKHYFVEHDEPADPIASVRASYHYLKTVGR